MSGWGRDSAGAPPKPGSVVEFRGPYGEITRHHSFVCRHCGLPRWIPPGQSLSDIAKCIICWGLVCHWCEPKGDCKEAGEFMKQVERSEARHRFRVACGFTE